MKESKVDPTTPESGPGWEKRRSDASKFYFPEEEGRTEQSHKDSCDINIMMARYEKTGILPRTASGELFFGDFSDVADFQSAQIALIAATESFMQLPAKVRAKFDNDPDKLLKFIGDKKNRDEAITLGLIDPAPPPDPIVSEIQALRKDLAPKDTK